MLIGAVFTYFKYNSTRQVAVGLIRAGKENFNIKKSSCKTYPCCWSFRMLLSSICCCTKDCCCSRYRRNETGTENVPLMRNETLSLLVDMEHDLSPSGKWKKNSQINLPKDAQNKFNKMLGKCIGITNLYFLKHFQKYASSLLNRHSSYCRHPLCIEENHAKFTHYCCLTDSILYYGVLDWNNLREKNTGKTFVKNIWKSIPYLSQKGLKFQFD